MWFRAIDVLSVAVNGFRCDEIVRALVHPQVNRADIAQLVLRQYRDELRGLDQQPPIPGKSSVQHLAELA